MRFCLSLVAVLLCAELAVRAASPRLPEPLEWYHELAQLKADQLRHVPGHGTLFIGSSATMRGLDPSRIVPGGYNAALPDARPQLLELWLDDAVLAHSPPSRVVYGIQSLDLKALDSDSLARYRQARGTSHGLWKEAERNARVLDVVRYRPALRSGGQLLSALRGEPSPLKAYAKDLEPDGYAPLKGSLLQLDSAKLGRPGYRATVERRVRAAADGLEVAALRRIVSRLQRDGVDVIFVVLPHPQRYWELVPEDQERDQQAFHRLVDGFGARVVDLSRSLTDDRSYADFVHLTPEGARRASDLFQEALNGVTPAPR